jgi:hypothetical protein
VVPADTCTHALASATGFVDAVRPRTLLQPTHNYVNEHAALIRIPPAKSPRPLWRIPGAVVRHTTVAPHGEIGGWTCSSATVAGSGVRSLTAVVPEQGIAVSVCLHATDGEPQAMVDNILRI